MIFGFDYFPYNLAISLLYGLVFSRLSGLWNWTQLLKSQIDCLCETIKFYLGEVKI